MQQDMSSGGYSPLSLLEAQTGLVLVAQLTSKISTARFSDTLAISPDSHNGLDAESIALVFQIVELVHERFRHRIGAGTIDTRDPLKYRKQISIYDSGSRYGIQNCN